MVGANADHFARSPSPSTVASAIWCAPSVVKGSSSASATAGRPSRSWIWAPTGGGGGLIVVEEVLQADMIRISGRQRRVSMVASSLPVGAGPHADDRAAGRDQRFVDLE